MCKNKYDKRKKKNKKNKKRDCGQYLAQGSFLSKHFLFCFFSIFEIKLWAWGENTHAPPFCFLPPHPIKHTPKNFLSYFLFKVFYPPYFTSKQRREGERWER